MKLLWTRIANADRKVIREYIAQDNPTAALALDELISEHSKRLADHPELGRPGRMANTRELVAHPHYIVNYDTSADGVRILRVLHAARKWPPERGQG